MHHELKSAGVDQVQRSLSAGGSVVATATSFYSGGYTYTHVLTTKRGTQYRVSKQVMRVVAPTPKQMDDRWEKALLAPLDQTRSIELPGGEYDDSRPLYRCAVCLDFGEKSLHRYVDECPSFGD